ncbi:MAG: hypothetical protein ACKOXB_08670 [Flavobacteriales bacterium]
MAKGSVLKAASWFVAIVAVLSLILFFMGGLLDDHLFDLILFAILLFVISDLMKKYKAEKKKWHLPVIIFFSLLVLLYIVLFLLEIGLIKSI